MTGSWRTTLIGAATAFFAFVLFSPETFVAFPWLVALSKFAVCGGLAGQGILSKDYNVTGRPMQVDAPAKSEEPKP